MIILKKWQLRTLLLANVIALNAYGNLNAKNKTSETEKVQKVEKSSQTSSQGTSKVQTKLDKAKKNGKAVFVVVTGSADTEKDKATTIAKSAVAKYKNAVMVEMNRDDVANAELVNKWRLSGAQTPLIMVISPKGYPTGGYLLNEATSDKIVELVPSPKMDNTYEALNNSKAVFIIVSKKSYTDKSQIIENCNAAIKQLQNKAIVVDVDLDDKKESAFIKQLNLKSTPNTTVAIVLNANGQTTGYFEGKAQSNELVLAANKVIKSRGCCSGGRNASCGSR